MRSISKLARGVVGWFDTHKIPEKVDYQGDTNWKAFIRLSPFWIVHLMCLGVIWVGWSPVAVGVAVSLYFLRMFAITGFYHRYFSHKTFKAGRIMQFVMGVWGNTAVQKGPLWWAGHHRHHHRNSDQPGDSHSPSQDGFWHSHILWLGKKANVPTKFSGVKDLSKFPELRFIDRFDLFVPVAFAVCLWSLGAGLQHFFPQLGTSGMQMLIWGFFISTVALFHGTATINSLGHIIGKRRYKTGDDSTNSWILAFVTLGEGWHNNHHHFQISTRQGFYWWEVDITYYGLWFMSKLGLIYDLKPVPARIRDGRPEKAEQPAPPPKPEATPTPNHTPVVVRPRESVPQELEPATI